MVTIPNFTGAILGINTVVYFRGDILNKISENAWRMPDWKPTLVMRDIIYIL
jgi:hypothetical protein